MTRTIVITGGSSGIGAATADAFAALGDVPYVLDVAPSGAAHRSIAVDVRDAASLTRAVDQAAAETGRLDAVIGCAGINRDGVFWKLSEDDWRSVLDVNLDGSFHLLRAALPHFRSQQRGAVVLVASINGERGWFGQANYSASKAGVIALAKTAAREIGRFGVRVNAVSPGYIDTPMTRPLPPELVQLAREQSPLGRIGRADEVASAIVFLCSEAASYITGVVLRVDGGQVA